MVVIRGPDNVDRPRTEQYPPVNPPMDVIPQRSGWHGHSRRWLIMAAVLILLVVMAIPVAIAALVRDNGSGSGAGLPSATAQPTAPASQPASAPAPSGTPATAPALIGGIPRGELLNGTFDIPPWPPDAPWPTGAKLVKHLTFTDGQAAGMPDGIRLTIGQIGYADVDHDGRAETLATLSLSLQGAVLQVAAFTRDGSGAIVPFGQVVATDPNNPSKTVVRDIDVFRAGDNGVVNVSVGADAICCGVTRPMVQYQWRGYGWTGSRFKQVSGPTEFGRDLRFADLVVSAKTLKLGPVTNGARLGTLSFTVKNTGKVNVGTGMMSVSVDLTNTGLLPGGPHWTGFTNGYSGMWQGDRTAPKAGQTITFNLDVVRSEPPSGQAATLSVRVWPTGGDATDAWGEDNSATVRIIIPA